MEILGQEIDLSNIPEDGISFSYNKAGVGLKVYLKYFSENSNSIDIKVKYLEFIGNIILTEESQKDEFIINNVNIILLKTVFSNLFVNFILSH